MINLENFLFLCVATIELSAIVIASKGFMIITTLTLGSIGIALLKFAK